MNTGDNDRIADILTKAKPLRQLNADIQRDYREKRHERNAVRNSAAVARFQAAKPEQWRAKKHRADVLASRADISPELLAEADRQHAAWLTAPVFVCHYCGKEVPPGKRSVDHVVPLSKGGKHVPTNLRPACRSCNSRKHAQSDYFA